MKQNKRHKIWVAVRVERGFPVEAKGFLKKSSAIKMEKTWRIRMNPDYDETDVLPLNMSTN